MRKSLTMFMLISVIGGQISAQTLVASFPNMTMLYFNFGESRSVGFENSEYLIGIQGNTLGIINTTNYSIEYTYTLSEGTSGNILLNDINGNGHPEVIVQYRDYDNSSGEMIYSTRISIIDLESNQSIFEHNSDTLWLQPAVFLNSEGIWHLLLSVYLYPAGATGSWIYDLNLPASTTDVAQFNHQQGSPHSLSNYPNPFNSSTTIEYSLESQGPLDIIIYDSLGRVVKSIHQPTVAPGTNEYSWDGLDDFGRKTASGLYHVRVISESSASGKSIMLVK
jgi:hypothetical protein